VSLQNVLDGVDGTKLDHRSPELRGAGRRVRNRRIRRGRTNGIRTNRRSMMLWETKCLLFGAR
jgi:hypothetical protein